MFIYKKNIVMTWLRDHTTKGSHMILAHNLTLSIIISNITFRNGIQLSIFLSSNRFVIILLFNIPYWSKLIPYCLIVKLILRGYVALGLL